MKTVEIKDQVSLPLSRCAELVLSGIRFRLFRAAVTVTIIALAVAFLTTMLTQSLVTKEVAKAVEVRTASRKLLLFWVGRITSPITDDELTADLAGMEPESDRWKEFATWGQLNDATLKRLARIAQSQVAYTTFFDRMDRSQRLNLIDLAKGDEVFSRIQTPAALAAFTERLETEIKPMAARKFPGSVKDFGAFCTEWQETTGLRNKIVAGHSTARARLDKLLAGKTGAEALVSGDETLVRNLTATGFVLNLDDLKAIAAPAKLELDAAAIQHTMRLPVIKSRLGRRTGTAVGDVNEEILFKTTSSSNGAEWLVKQMDEQKQNLVQADKAFADEAKNAAKMDDKLRQEYRTIRATRNTVTEFTLDTKRVEEVANAWLDKESLAEVEAAVSRTSSDENIMGFPPRTLWLIVVSFMVCIVGITNAMLMSVTERFREIATMKCLGATDAFIMINFVMESCLQGIAGGLVGGILGVALGALRGGFDYGWIAMETFPLLSGCTCAALSMIAGIMISALAAVYPAWMAARLAPMEAMRIE